MDLCPTPPASIAPTVLQRRPGQRQGQALGSGRGPLHAEGEKNKKDCHQSANSALGATADYAGTQPQQDPPGHYHKLVKGPCTNHDYPVKHLYKDCQLLKCLLRQVDGPKEENGEEAETEKGDVAGKDPDD